jgi:hypothetical protein
MHQINVAARVFNLPLFNIFTALKKIKSDRGCAPGGRSAPEARHPTPRQVRERGGKGAAACRARAVLLLRAHYKKQTLSVVVAAAIERTSARSFHSRWLAGKWVTSTKSARLLLISPSTGVYSVSSGRGAHFASAAAPDALAARAPPRPTRLLSATPNTAPYTERHQSTTAGFASSPLPEIDPNIMRVSKFCFW